MFLEPDKYVWIHRRDLKYIGNPYGDANNIDDAMLFANPPPADSLYHGQSTNWHNMSRHNYLMNNSYNRVKQ